MLETIMGIANLVPGLVSLFKGDEAGEVAQKTVDVAKQVTGTDDEVDAVDKIKRDPDLKIKFQEAMNPIVIAKLEQKTRQLETVNQTMRAEYDQDDLYTKRWRPTYGYSSCPTWVIQMCGIIFVVGWAVVTSPKEAPEVISALSGLVGVLMPLWGIALSVLGISVSRRSDDKAVKLGHKPKAGALQTIAGMFKRGKG